MNAVAALLILLASGCIALDDGARTAADLPRRPDGPAPYYTIVHDAFGNSNMRSSAVHMAIGTEEAWRDFWHEYTTGDDPRPSRPGVFFGDRFIVVTSRGEQGSAGHQINLVGIEWNGAYKVRYDHVDAKGCAVAAAVTHPIHIVEVDRMGAGVPRVAFVHNATKSHLC